MFIINWLYLIYYRVSLQKLLLEIRKCYTRIMFACSLCITDFPAKTFRHVHLSCFGKKNESLSETKLDQRCTNLRNLILDAKWIFIKDSETSDSRTFDNEKNWTRCRTLQTAFVQFGLNHNNKITPSPPPEIPLYSPPYDFMHTILICSELPLFISFFFF